MEMLKVKLLRKGPVTGQGVQIGPLVGFRIHGHADFSEHGQDIVCAGASAIAQAALMGLQDVLGSKVRFHKEPGFLEVYVFEEAGELAPQAILRTLELGLLSISRAYADYIDLTYENVI
jgi:uncharacterized protein YsxB (DUF464 family)